MLDYTGEDLEEVYYQTFRIWYTDVFGNAVFHDLKEDGDNIFVTQENKRVSCLFLQCEIDIRVNFYCDPRNFCRPTSFELNWSPRISV